VTRSRAEVQLLGAMQALLFFTVLWVALSNSHIYPLDIPVGRDVRWVALGLLAAAAVGYAALAGRDRLEWMRLALPAAAFLVLAAASVMWSSDAALSLGRLLSLAVLFAVGIGVGAAASRGADVEPILLAILGAAVAVAVGGLLELWNSPDDAVIPATIEQGARYTGIGQNPNTMSMLLAVSLPLATWAIVTAPTMLLRGASVVLFALLDGSIVASGSRGAIVGGLAGSLVVLLATVRRRLLAVGAIAALLAASLVIAQLPRPAASDPVGRTAEFGQTVPVSPFDLNARFPLENEIAAPKSESPFRRTLFSTGGRAAAWKGALEQYAERPLAGFAFGTEEVVFVDRYALFRSARIENSYISTLLQLGPLGLGLLIAAVAVPLWAWVRGRPRSGARWALGAACAGVVTSGVVVGFSQSFITSVGSPATAPFWLCLVALAGLAARPERRHREGDEREQEPSERHGETSLDVVRGEDQRVDGEQPDDAAARTPARHRKG
jgi:hypothetical protein